MHVIDEYIIGHIFSREDPIPFLQQGTTSIITLMIVLGPSMSPAHPPVSVLPFFLLTFTSTQQAEVKYGSDRNMKASINTDKVMSPHRRRSPFSICKYNRSFQHCCSHQQAGNEEGAEGWVWWYCCWISDNNLFWVDSGLGFLVM